MGTVGLKRVSDCLYTALYKCCTSTSPIATGILPDLSGDEIKSCLSEGLGEKGCNRYQGEQGINTEQI